MAHIKRIAYYRCREIFSSCLESKLMKSPIIRWYPIMLNSISSVLHVNFTGVQVLWTTRNFPIPFENLTTLFLVFGNVVKHCLSGLIHHFRRLQTIFGFLPLKKLPVKNIGHFYVRLGYFKHPTFCLVHAVIIWAGICNVASPGCHVCSKAIRTSCRGFKQEKIIILTAVNACSTIITRSAWNLPIRLVLTPCYYANGVKSRLF